LNQVLRFMAIISIPSIFGLIILGRYIMRLFFGYPFLDAVLSLYFLSFLIFPFVFIVVLSSLFLAEGRSSIFAKMTLVTAILNILLNIILVKIFLIISPLWATAGAAIGTTTSWFFYMFSFAYLSRKKLGISISFGHVIKPIFSSIIMSLYLLASLKFIKDMTFALGVFELILGMFVYLISMLLLKGITTKDLNLIKILFRHEKTK